jgi:hypothetical protein
LGGAFFRLKKRHKKLLLSFFIERLEGGGESRMGNCVDEF